MPHEYTITRLVEFADTDAAGLMHFSNFFRFMEAAEHAFLRSLGHSVHAATDDGLVGWPRLRAACAYRRPLRFEDTVEVRLLVREVRRKSIAYDFVFRKIAPGAPGAPGVPEEVARGSLVVVCAACKRGEQTWASALIPADLAAKIEPAPPELLAALDAEPTPAETARPRRPSPPRPRRARR